MSRYKLMVEFKDGTEHFYYNVRFDYSVNYLHIYNEEMNISLPLDRIEDCTIKLLAERQVCEECVGMMEEVRFVSGRALVCKDCGAKGQIDCEKCRWCGRPVETGEVDNCRWISLGAKDVTWYYCDEGCFASDMKRFVKADFANPFEVWE